MELWVGCIAGALEEMDYVKLLAKAGFVLETSVQMASGSTVCNQMMSGSSLSPHGKTEPVRCPSRLFGVD
jgi:hypothetical protein